MSGGLSLLWRFFLDGGVVMWPILGLSLLSCALCAERALFWLTARRASGRRFARIVGALRQGDDTTAGTLVEDDVSVIGWFVRGLRERGASEAAALELLSLLRPRLERWSTTLSTIITAAPMLGILGTVAGIIDSFRLLGAADQRVVAPSEVAHGIAVALYTTAFGLVVAIGTLFPYVVFRAQAERMLDRLEALASAAVEGASRRR